MEELMSEIIDELKIELELTEESDIAILTVKVKNAIREVKKAFNFKPWHEDEFIMSQLTDSIGNIKMLASYDFAKIGAEGESSHDEKNIRREYLDRQKCFAGIVPYAD